MRKPQKYQFEYLSRHDDLFFVGLKGPRGGADTAPDSRAAARRVVVVTTYDVGACWCSVVGCGRVAELLISVRPAWAGPGLWPSCVDHWGSVRSVFVGRGDQIDYGPGAPERIIERASDRRVFGDVVALEQQRRHERE